jgi:hypothetical protein
MEQVSRRGKQVGHFSTNLAVPSQALKPFGLELIVQIFRGAYFRLRHFGCVGYETG